MTPISILLIIGVVFLFLAAFGINFSRILSGWMGLALIYLALVLPRFGLDENTRICLIALVLIVIVVTLFARRPAV